MKQLFNTISIKAKLIFLLSLSAFIALTISFSIMSVYYIKKDLNWSLQATSNLAAVSAKNIIASLTFLDVNSIESILLPLFDDKDIVSVKVYDANGNLFVNVGKMGKYEVKKDDIAAAKLKYERTNITYDFIEVLRPIYFENELIGYLEIVKSTKSIKDKVIDQILFSFFVILLSLAAIFILSFQFEKIFSKPIYNLLDAIKSIQKNDDYNFNVISETRDEFHDLYREFNHMIDEIQKRDVLLKTYNVNLEQEVHKTSDKLKKTQNKLEEATLLATTDPMTGLANRRSAMERFEEMLEESRSNCEYIGVLMADIDHFKNVNDTYGHPVGDEAIKMVASVLNRSVRKSDLAARIGGEEFLVLFEHGNSTTVHEIAQRIREKIAQTTIPLENDEKFNITISLGFCSLVPQNQSVEELLKVADEALYEAKKSGRNKVVEKGV